MNTDMFLNGLVLIGSVGTLVALYYAIVLSVETKNERYWLALAMSAGFFALHQWLLIPWEFGIIGSRTRFVLEQISVVISSILFGYSVYGLYSSMKKIRERLEK